MHLFFSFFFLWAAALGAVLLETVWQGLDPAFGFPVAVLWIATLLFLFFPKPWPFFWLFSTGWLLDHFAPSGFSFLWLFLILGLGGYGLGRIFHRQSFYAWIGFGAFFFLFYALLREITGSRGPLVMVGKQLLVFLILLGTSLLFVPFARRVRRAFPFRFYRPFAP